PATADSRIVGTRKDMTSALTAAFERVVAKTRIVRAESAMVTPICVDAWMNQSRLKAGSRRSGTARFAVTARIVPGRVRPGGQSRGGRRLRSSFDGRGSWPGRGGRGGVPGAMFGRGSAGGPLRAAPPAAAQGLGWAA